MAGSVQERESAPRVSLQFIAREFLLPAILLTGVIIPLYLTAQYKSGQLRDAVLVVVLWAILVFVYWLPIGMFLFRRKAHWLRRLVTGYLVSLPLYFLALLFAYPTLGARFHPRSPAEWGIYSSATPTFYLIVLGLYLLVRGGRILARITQSLAALAFAVSLIGTTVLVGRIDKYKWTSQAAQRVDIVNARIVDAPERKITQGQNVLIENGRIVQVVSADSDQGSRPAIDAKGGYLVPGLIDVHVHLQAPIRSVLGGFDFRYFLDSILGDWARQRRAYLEDGITAIRDLGGPAAHIFALRTEVNEHKLLGPRIFAVGRLVTSPQGHPVSTIWTPAITRQGAILASDPASLGAGLDKNYQEGPPDAVKIIYGTIGIAKEKISPALLDSAVAWAKGKGLLSVVHIETVQEALDAVNSGATGIEHVAMIESLPDSLVATIVAHQTLVDPTFGEYQTALALRHVGGTEIDQLLHQKYGFIRQLHAAGVRIVIGTDAPLVPFGEGFEDELDHFAKAGFTPAQILTFATQNNAAYLGRPTELGKIAPGYDADILLVRQNPLDGLGALRRPDWVMLDGQIVAGSMWKYHP
jgi:imidazolonepropionase-like amidohydrolase